MSFQNRSLWHRIISMLVVAALLWTGWPSMKTWMQDKAPEIVILPIDRATFLPGAKFDLRIEVHADAMPKDFAATINGKDAEKFLGAAGKAESWKYGPENAQKPAQAMTWRAVSLQEAGAYTVSVTAGGTTKTVHWEVSAPTKSAGAKNVILMIGDGMTVSMLTAARLVSRGNSQGKYNGALAIDEMEHLGLVHTSGMDSIVTDSANSMSAYSTGHKSAVNALGVYPDSSPDTQDDPRVETFAELIKRTRQMAVGIVTTAAWTDATPAGVFAHTRRRGDEPFIAAEPLDEKLFPEVILGGGAAFMLPKSAEGSRRTDERDLYKEYTAAGYQVVTSGKELSATMAVTTPTHLLGMFHPSHMNVWLDRNVYKKNLGKFPDQPGLVDMTNAALKVLSQNKNGFFLMVEGASIDKQMHTLDIERMLADTIEFDNTVAAVREWAKQNAPDTLIVVVADHGHAFDVYGTVDVAKFNAGKTDAERRGAIRTYENAGFPEYKDADGDHFPDTWVVSHTLAAGAVDHPDYTEDFQVSEKPRVPSIINDKKVAVDNPEDDTKGITMTGNLPLDSNSEVHSLQDVPVFASGPGSEFFGHVLDNTQLFFGMANAIGLNPAAK